MPVGKYSPRKITREIIKIIADEEVVTPTHISTKMGLDRRTVDKYIEVCEDLGTVKCKDIAAGKKTIKACYLTNHGRKLVKGKER